MNIIFKFLLAVIFMLSPLKLMAHADHGSFETIDGLQATKVASEAVQSLVTDKKLPDSWKNAKPSAAITRESKYGPVWVVSFQNPEEEDTSKKTLYVILDEFGNPVSANHEGEAE